MKDGILAGLLSGLIVTIFVIVFRLFWQRILVPWFEELVYKDAKIEGKWFSLYPTSVDLRKEAVNLVRHGHAVSGLLICSEGPDEGQSYTVRGSFRNMILPLIYETEDRSRTDRGTITLRSVGDAQRLEGTVAFYHTHKDAIHGAQVIWFRSKSDLEQLAAKISKSRQELDELVKKQEETAKNIAKLTDAQTETEIRSGSTPNQQEGEHPAAALPLLPAAVDSKDKKEC